MTDPANSNSSQPELLTPEDFPRNQGGAVPGAQPKLLALKVDGEYVQSISESELYARYDTCFDLVNQLQTYCNRKLNERPEWTPEILLRRLRIGVARRGDWGCSVDEQRWIVKQLCHRMNWPESASESDSGEFKSLYPELTITDQQLIDKLLGLKYTSEGELAPPEAVPETLVDQVRKKLGAWPTTRLEQ